MTNEMQRSWIDSMPDAYEHLLVPTVFEPFAVDLTRRVVARAPRRVLELAAGTGVVTREIVAAAPDADVTATDLNAAMVEGGRAREPRATWRQADAMKLPFEAGEFDLVVCQFGIMFFPDRPAAFAEARRVLAPGGAFIANTWGPVDTHDFQAAVIAGLKRAFPEDLPPFLAVVPHGYHDLAVVVADLRAGGFDDVNVETVTLEGHAASAADVAAGYCTGTPLRSEIEVRGDLSATTTTVAREIEARLGTGAISGRMTAHVVEAMPPA